MKVAIYLRVSTKDQNLDLQRNELMEFCQTKGWTNITTYEDHGVSGTTVNRKGLNKLIADCEAGKVEILLTWKIDRLFRSLKHLVITIDKLESMGVKFISLKDSLDFTTPTGVLMFQMLGAFAEFERNIIAERVTAGMKAAKARGVHVGRPKTRNDAAIISLRKSGLTMKEIADELSTSVGAVQRALAN